MEYKCCPSPQVRHCVAKALNLHGTQLVVHGEVGEVHVAGGLDSQPDAPEDVAALGYSQELILCCCFVKSCHLLIDKERVRHPDKADILGSNYKLIDPAIRAIEGKPPVRPELSEVLKMK